MNARSLVTRFFRHFTLGVDSGPLYPGQVRVALDPLHRQRPLVAASEFVISPIRCAVMQSLVRLNQVGRARARR